MKTLAKRMLDFLRNEDGPTATEYAFMLALMAGGAFFLNLPFGAWRVRTRRMIPACVPNPWQKWPKACPV